jgi:hypothetical protein
MRPPKGQIADLLRIRREKGPPVDRPAGPQDLFGKPVFPFFA